MFQTDQSAFAFEVINYETPHGGRSLEDKNLLLTYLQLVDKGNRWETIAPILHTWELQRFKGWLSDILLNRQSATILTISEPCIAIHLKDVSPNGQKFTFCFLLSYEAIPPWSDTSLDEPYPLFIECDRRAVLGAIGFLSNQLTQFPVR